MSLSLLGCNARKRVAICFSGGGIRSATFGLGILQALASCSQQEDGRRPRLLGEFDFLSTVSGGGYLGGWISRWAAADRRAGLTLRNGLIITGSGAVVNLMREFLSRQLTPTFPRLRRASPSGTLRLNKAALYIRFAYRSWQR